MCGLGYPFESKMTPKRACTSDVWADVWAWLPIRAKSKLVTHSSQKQTRSAPVTVDLYQRHSLSARVQVPDQVRPRASLTRESVCLFTTCAITNLVPSQRSPKHPGRQQHLRGRKPAQRANDLGKPQVGPRANTGAQTSHNMISKTSCFYI